MRPPLLADENVPAPSVARLRAEGLDVASVLEDAPGLPDADVIGLARRLGRVLVTLDSDIGERIYRLGDAPPPGVLTLRFVQANPEAAVEVVLQILDLDDVSVEGRFVT